MKSTAALCLGLSVAALSRAPQQQFSTRTDLVAIDVHVTDANGRPVHGLESGDFEVFEGGQRRPIQAFVHVRPEPEAWATPWMAGVRQNVTQNQQATGRLMAIILDDAAMEPEATVLNSAKAIARNLVEGMSANDRAAIVFTRDSRGAQPFTNDRIRLTEAIERLGVGMVGGRGARQDVTDSLYHVGTLATIQNVLSAMGTTRHLPKAVIYVGAGIPLDRKGSSAVLGSTGGQDAAISCGWASFTKAAARLAAPTTTSRCLTIPSRAFI